MRIVGELTLKAQRTMLTGVPTDAHDARCYGAAAKKLNQLMLMMLAPVLPAKNLNPWPCSRASSFAAQSENRTNYTVSSKTINSKHRKPET